MFDTLEDCTIVRHKSRGKGRTARANPCKNLTSRFRSYFSYIHSCNNTTLIVSFSLYIIAFGHVYFRDFNAFRRSAACFDRLMNLSGGHSLDIRRDRESYAISRRSPGKRRHSSLFIFLSLREGLQRSYSARPCESRHAYLHKTYVSNISMGILRGDETKRRGLVPQWRGRLLRPIAPTALLPAVFTFVVTIRWPPATLLEEKKKERTARGIHDLPRVAITNTF